MWVPKGDSDGVMVYRNIYDKNWYLHPREAILYREIRQSDHVFPLMQETGYFDSEGVSLYQDDIVRFFEPGNMWEGESNSEGIFTVVWDLEHLQWYADFMGHDRIALCEIDPMYLTVISSIYEKPELLEIEYANNI
jgi:hypothetical protein